jgi:hypothetical protein
LSRGPRAGLRQVGGSALATYPSGWLQTQLALAVSLCGISPAKAGFLYTDFYSLGPHAEWAWQSNNVGGGISAALRTDAPGGVVRLTCPTGNKIDRYSPASLTAAASATKFFMAARGTWVSGAIGGNAQICPAGMVTQDHTQVAQLGIVAGVSTTNFAYVGLTSTIAIDHNPHDLRGGWDGARHVFQVDSEPTIFHTASGSPFPGVMFAWQQNDQVTGVATVVYDVDQALWVWESP